MPASFGQHRYDMNQKKRKKIQFSYEDYCRTIGDQERSEFQSQYRPLIEIIYAAGDDQEILERSREYDVLHHTDIFSLAIDFKTYCIACHRVDCVC